jgi:hypothetical protein
VFSHVIRIQIAQQAAQGHEPVQRATVQQMPAHAGGNDAADGAFAGTRRSVDGDDGNADGHLTER